VIEIDGTNLKILQHQTALDNINAAWKTAIVCSRRTRSSCCRDLAAEGDNVQDVDYEEVK
jgi:hypothetical protein